MTLSKLMFFNFLYVGCDGNKSAVARELEIYRPRVNAIIAELNQGSSLGPTMPKLLEQYRRHGMDINATVDLYLKSKEGLNEWTCPVHIQLVEARTKWRIMEKSPYMAVAEVYEQARVLADCVEKAFCCQMLCESELDEKCPCWWIAGLMDSLLSMISGDNDRNRQK